MDCDKAYFDPRNNYIRRFIRKMDIYNARQLIDYVVIKGKLLFLNG